ncbi:MAG: lamin tail domain-containing protein [Anaerolineae bacterium]
MLHRLITVVALALALAPLAFIQAGGEITRAGSQPFAPRFSGSTTLVINEIDYDQASTDTAEFIEIKNVSGATINLAAYEIRIINGTGGGASLKRTISLSNTNLASGSYYVVCGNAANVANCDQDVSPDKNLIENGNPGGTDPDAVALALKGSGTVVDTVSYEGDTAAPYTEGSGVGLEDDPAIGQAGISRYPDGTDTDQNNVDLSRRCITPGAANASANSNCEPATAVSLLSFTAEVQGRAVTLAWETGTEIDNAGFNLYRATAPDGPYVQINPALIAARGDPVSGASYSFTDRPGYGVFAYRLEDVDYAGVSAFHGPISVVVRGSLRRPRYRPIPPQ